MKVKIFENKNVNEDGTCLGGGAVHTKGAVVESNEEGGCDLEHCDCSEGHWFSVVMPLDINKKVRGVTILFDSVQEKEMFMDVIHNHFGTPSKISSLKYDNIHLKAELDKNTEYMKEAQAKIAKFEGNLEIVKKKVTQHWLVTAFERWKAGDSEEDILADFGYEKHLDSHEG